MPEPIKALIDAIILEAKRRGISQSQLAGKAGLSAVGFSKAKHRGDLRASTLAALAQQLDLELALVPRRAPEQAVAAIKSGTFFAPAGPNRDSGR